MAPDFIAKMTRYFWFMCSICGLLYQTVHISQMYFSYQVSTAVKVLFRKTITPPSVSLCFYIVHLIQWERVNVDYPNLMNKLNLSGSISDVQLNVAKMVFYEQFALQDLIMQEVDTVDKWLSMTFTAEQLLAGCAMADYETYSPVFGLDCSKIYEIVETFAGSHKCFTFFRRTNATYNYLSLQQRPDNPGFLAAIELSNATITATNDMTLTYTDGRRQPRMGFNRVSHLDDIRQMLSYTYIHYENNNLPHPFPTRCRNYSLDGFTDRGACFEGCLNKKALRGLKKLFSGTQLSTSDYGQNGVFSMNEAGVGTVLGNFTDMKTKCDAACWQPDCHDVQYTPMLLSSSENNVPVVFLVSEMQPSVVTVYSQRFTVLQYMTDIFSSTGFCKSVEAPSLLKLPLMLSNFQGLGFSVFSFYEISKTMAVRVKQLSFDRGHDDVFGLRSRNVAEINVLTRQQSFYRSPVPVPIRIHLNGKDTHDLSFNH